MWLPTLSDVSLDRFTYRNDREPGARRTGGTIGSAVEQVDSFAEDALGEEGRGGNELECEHCAFVLTIKSDGWFGPREYGACLDSVLKLRRQETGSFI